MNMVENQCETNCECVETQRSSEQSNGANECSCCCQKDTPNKTNNPCFNDDPIAGAKSLLEKSFFKALTEVHIEKLKKQIKTEWSSTIDKTVDLTMKTIAKQWQ